MLPARRVAEIDLAQDRHSAPACAGCKAASGYALHSFAARAQSTQESGQPTCYQTGQFYLLPTIRLQDSMKTSTACTIRSHSTSPMGNERLIIPRRASHTPWFSI